MYIYIYNFILYSSGNLLVIMPAFVQYIDLTMEYLFSNYNN